MGTGGGGFGSVGGGGGRAGGRRWKVAPGRGFGGRAGPGLPWVVVDDGEVRGGIVFLVLFVWIAGGGIVFLTFFVYRGSMAAGNWVGGGAVKGGVAPKGVEVADFLSPEALLLRRYVHGWLS